MIPKRWYLYVNEHEFWLCKAASLHTSVQQSSKRKVYANSEANASSRQATSCQQRGAIPGREKFQIEMKSTALSIPTFGPE